MGKSVFVTFVGGWGESGPERALALAQGAIALDNLAKAVGCGGFDRHVMVTDEPELLDIKLSGVEVERSPTPFHFGRCLQDVLRRHDAERACCLGGGSMPLAPESLFGEVAQRLSESSDTVIANNLYSGDMTAFTPAAALECIALPEIDNPLPRLLRDQGGLTAVALDKSIETLMDVDTPTDLAVLSLYPRSPESIKQAVTATELQRGQLRRAIACFTDKDARVTVGGRVGSFVWSRLETDTACRCRVISEGRGMRAEGPCGAGRSVLGYLLDSSGVSGFFDRLAEMGDAAFIDTRVIFNHFGKAFPASDRFHSDMLEWKSVADPWLREFTQGAREATIPVVLGGHSLVSGGMLALIDAAWGGLVRRDDKALWQGISAQPGSLTERACQRCTPPPSPPW